MDVKASQTCAFFHCKLYYWGLPCLLHADATGLSPLRGLAFPSNRTLPLDPYAVALVQSQAVARAVSPISLADEVM